MGGRGGRDGWGGHGGRGGQDGRGGWVVRMVTLLEKHYFVYSGGLYSAKGIDQLNNLI